MRCANGVQGHRSVVSGLQHDHAVRLRAEPEQHLPVRPGRPDHFAGRFPEHLPDQNVGTVHRVHVGLRGDVQQSVEGAQAAHEPEEERHQGDYNNNNDYTRRRILGLSSASLL